MLTKFLHLEKYYLTYNWHVPVNTHLQSSTKLYNKL